MDQDKTLTCSDCGAEFIFTAKDQAYYDQQGFVPPKRCRACRDARKQGGGQRARAPRGGSYGGGGGGFDDGYANRGDQGGGGYQEQGAPDEFGNQQEGGFPGHRGGPRGGGFQGGGGGGGGRFQRFVADRPRKPLYDAVCSSCGKATTVPFRPAAGRPVYCRDCYKMGKGAPER